MGSAYVATKDHDVITELAPVNVMYAHNVVWESGLVSIKYKKRTQKIARNISTKPCLSLYVNIYTLTHLYVLILRYHFFTQFILTVCRYIHILGMSLYFYIPL